MAPKRKYYQSSLEEEEYLYDNYETKALIKLMKVGTTLLECLEEKKIIRVYRKINGRGKVTYDNCKNDNEVDIIIPTGEGDGNGVHWIYRDKYGYKHNSYTKKDINDIGYDYQRGGSNQFCQWFAFYFWYKQLEHYYGKQSKIILDLKPREYIWNAHEIARFIKHIISSKTKDVLDSVYTVYYVNGSHWLEEALIDCDRIINCQDGKIAPMD